jgi:hypothetical protein
MTIHSNHDSKFTSEVSSRSHLVIEGFAIYRYLLGVTPHIALVKKYVRCVEHLRSGVPLVIPKLFIVFPRMLAIFDRTKLDDVFFQREFFWRINSASFICESTTYGASIYLGIDQKRGVIGSLFGLFKAGFFEIMARIGCYIFHYPVRLYFAKRK